MNRFLLLFMSILGHERKRAYRAVSIRCLGRSFEAGRWAKTLFIKRIKELHRKIPLHDSSIVSRVKIVITNKFTESSSKESIIISLRPIRVKMTKRWVRWKSSEFWPNWLWRANWVPTSESRFWFMKKKIGQFGPSHNILELPRNRSFRPYRVENFLTIQSLGELEFYFHLQPYLATK